jgi:hypothetical protein
MAKSYTVHDKPYNRVLFDAPPNLLVRLNEQAISLEETRSFLIRRYIREGLANDANKINQSTVAQILEMGSQAGVRHGECGCRCPRTGCDVS